MKILKKCQEAIPSKEKGGKLIIINMVMEINKGNAEAVKTSYMETSAPTELAKSAVGFNSP